MKPKEYDFLGWNLRRDLFKDRDVRMALYMLDNREEMIHKFRYDMSLPATGPWYQQNIYADPGVKPVGFNPKKAAELLKKAGWADSDKDGVLDKMINGKKVDFRFTLYYGNPTSEKYLVLYQNDLKKYGIDMQLQTLEWNAIIKNVQSRNFDVVYMSWGGGSINIDAKQIWHSASDVDGGSNYVGYRNSEVDKLIDQSRSELDDKKRIPILRKIYRIIADDVPYSFMFNDKYVLYARSSNIKVSKPTLKYELGFNYWWAAQK